MKALIILLSIAIILAVAAIKWFIPLLTQKKSRIGGAVTGIGIFLGLFGILLSGTFFYAEPGYSYLVQYPTGTQVAELTPGYHMYWYGNVLPFKKVLTVRLTDSPDVNSETATAQDNSVMGRFNDSVRAKISISTRFRLPEDEKRFMQMALDYRTQENLVQSSLVPVTREVVRNTARELSAQDYVTGQGGQFEANILDQMESGIVILKVVDESRTEEVLPIPEPIAIEDNLPEEQSAEDNTTLTNPEQKKDDIAKKDEDRGIRTSPKVYQRVVRLTNPDGTVKRKLHPITQYGISVTQSTVEDVDFETKFQEMLAMQRDAAAKAAVARQQAKQAEYEKQKVLAAGETEKARTQMEREKEQVDKVITAETQKKEAEIALITAETLKQKARVDGDAILLTATAQAEARRRKMVADGALEQKLEAWVKINETWAAAMKENKMVPNVVIGNGNGGKAQTASTDFMNVMTAMAANQLGLDTKITQK